MNPTKAGQKLSLAEIKERAQAEWEVLRNSAYVTIGLATCGHAARAAETALAFEQELSRHHIAAKIVPVGCLGLCYAEPLVTIFKPDSFCVVYHDVGPDVVPRLVTGYLMGDDPCLELALGTLEERGMEAPYIPELPRFEKEVRIVLRHAGYINPENINHYVACGGYDALAKALRMNPEAIIEEIKGSTLQGRGGAGFPTGLKWELCYMNRVTPKYIIVNADEGDPGAFMDRIVLESNPHQVIEGMIIAGYAIGVRQAYLYVRTEYPLAIRRVSTALRQAKELGLLGENILNSGFSFHVKVVKGAGAFVSGEETSLLSAIEGKASIPRPRPPYPVENGLWGKPTIVNNIKTFANVTAIIERGKDWFITIGTEESKGTALFSLAGNIKTPGLTEVPMGTTIGEIVFDIGDGIFNDRGFKAVQIGGPSGGCVPASMLDTPIDYASLREVGSTMGSGGFIVMSEDDCMVDAARFFLDFTTKESCGKCTPCRLGTWQMLETLEDIAAGQGRIEDIDFLIELARDIKTSALCALGRTAPNPVLTTIRYFRDDYEAHVREKCCPAKVCTHLTAYYILPDKCECSCEHCILTCPTEAISGEKGEIKHIDQEKCVNCGTCVEVCPPEYDAVIKVSPVNLLPDKDFIAKQKAAAKASEERIR
jgi:NADH-quinone oxidoreductase subunit F